MRIGLMTDTFLPVVDGVGRVVVAYANILPTLGHEVTVSAPLYNTGHRGGYPFELVDYSGFKVPTTPQYKMGSAGLDSNYRKRMDMIDLDLVHSHSPFSAGREALRIARQRNIPMISTFHSKYYDDFLKVTKSETIAKSMVQNIVNYYEKCDEVWTVSQTSREVLKEYGYTGEIHVMTNGTEQRSITEEDLQLIEEKYQLNGLPVLLFVGQINWKKNILRILESAALYKQESPAFKLVLVGQGPDEKEIRQKAEELGLAEQLIMPGMVQEMRVLDAFYKRADLFVFPSLYDTFSLVIREAAAMDTPSVAVWGSCAAESITHGVNGYLCEDDTDSLYQVIRHALSDRERNSEIGIKAHETIPIPWEDVLKQACERYENLITYFDKTPTARSMRFFKKRAQNE
ncbi:MAG TPA: glycosyltransferase family 4 protein [Clostridiales bacterium]|jgi:glycosyltransferase involved in cell wall biosynthesis|nr:glycosyltransferase family 4 protein [Clostridiales bacterium]